MKGDLLKGIMQWEMNDGKGFSGKLPVFYYDSTSMTATYTASTSNVKKYLPHKDMHPVEIFPGKCVVGFTAFEYRKSDIDPYNEFSISILITFGRKSMPGLGILNSLIKKDFTAFIWHLPVTTEKARYGGVELYGYPKIIADIEFKREKEFIECSLSEKGEHILTLKGKNIPGSHGKILRYRTYSIKDNVPLCANVYTNPLEFAQSLSGNDAAIEIGEKHSICSELKNIGLSKKPIMYQYSALNESILFAPRNLIDD